LKTIACAAGLVVLLTSATARADCSSNADCKGDRVCGAAGQCVAPALQAQPLPPPPPPPAVQVINPAPPPTPQYQQPAIVLQPPELGRKPVRTGWGLGAGILGFVMAGLSVGLAGASAATSAHLIPSLPLGAAGLGLTIIFGPIVASGGSSSRRGADVHGVVALRIVGWIFYGLTIAGGLAMVVMGIMEVAPPMPMFAVMAACDGVSMLSLSIDSLVAGIQAIARSNEASDNRQSSLELAPVVSPLLMPNGQVGLSAGLVGRF
jgi:hypothetical protein